MQSFEIPSDDDLLQGGLENGDYICKVASEVGQYNEGNGHQKDSWARLSRSENVPYGGTKAS